MVVTFTVAPKVVVSRLIAKALITPIMLTCVLAAKVAALATGTLLITKPLVMILLLAFTNWA